MAFVCLFSFYNSFLLNAGLCHAITIRTRTLGSGKRIGRILGGRKSEERGESLSRWNLGRVTHSLMPFFHAGKCWFQEGPGLVTALLYGIEGACFDRVVVRLLLVV